jgi:hypothetical protein
MKIQRAVFSAMTKQQPNWQANRRSALLHTIQQPMRQSRCHELQSIAFRPIIQKQCRTKTTRFSIKQRHQVLGSQAPKHGVPSQST